MDTELREHAVIIGGTTVVVRGTPRQAPTSWSMVVDTVEVDTASGSTPALAGRLPDGTSVEARVTTGEDGNGRLVFSHDSNELAVYSLAD